MSLKRYLSFLWKVPFCGVAFTVGIVLGGMIPTLLGLPAPALPEGTDQNTVLLYDFLASMVLAIALAVLARGLSGRFLTRWLILGFFIWVAHVVMFVEAAIFMTTGAVLGMGSTLFTIVMYIVPSFLCGAVVVWLFPAEVGPGFAANLGAFFARRPAVQWAWPWCEGLKVSYRRR